MQTNMKNTDTYSVEQLNNWGVSFYPNESDETLLISNNNLEFYETELSDVVENDNYYCITAAAYYVLTHERDDLFIREMINDNQTNNLMTEKLEEMLEKAFNKYPNDDDAAIDYLNDVLLEAFLDNDYLRVIY